MAQNKRYPSDLTDAQWELIEPLVARAAVGWPSSGAFEARRWPSPSANSAPQPSSATATTRRKENLERSSGPADSGLDNTVCHASPQASESEKDRTEDNGRKRHVVVDTMGLLLLVVITSASVQDRDGARTLLDRLTMAMPSLSLLWADGGYAGKLVDWAEAVAHITVEIVRKPLGIRMFQVLPRRWVVERTFAWIVKCRRLDHDYERLPETSEAMIKWAMIGLMVRRLEPPPGRKPWQHASTAA